VIVVAFLPVSIFVGAVVGVVDRRAYLSVGGAREVLNMFRLGR